MGMATLRNALLLLCVIFVPLLPARADDGTLGSAAARIEQLLKDGKLTDSEALGARSAKSLGANPSALSAAETATLASALGDLAYALASNRKVPDALVFIQQVVALRE